MISTDGRDGYIVEMEQEQGGALGDIPNEKWQKFFDRFLEYPTLHVTAWKPVHVLGYFSHQFWDTYGATYAYKYNSPHPSKSFEMFQIKKLAQVLSSDPQILKDYIDWVFTKVKKEKRRFTSISFLTREEVVKEYKMTVLFARKIDRTTLLPQNITLIFASLGDIKTYGDLAFLQQAMISSNEFKEALNLAIQNGFDSNILLELK